MPVVEPRPRPPRESRLGAPEDAQDASYFAASARIASLTGTVGARFSSFPNCSIRDRRQAEFVRQWSACIRSPQPGDALGALRRGSRAFADRGSIRQGLDRIAPHRRGLRVTSVRPSCRACATRSRSNGSRSIGGRCRTSRACAEVTDSSLKPDSTMIAASSSRGSESSFTRL
jgi:hypothetical protein